LVLLFFVATTAHASLRITAQGGPGLRGNIDDDQRNTFSINNFSLDLAARRHLVWEWDYMLGIGLHYGFVGYQRDGLEYKGFHDAIGLNGSLLHPLTLGWDIQLQGELVVRGLMTVKALGTQEVNGQAVDESIVRTADGFFGYAGRVFFLHSARWRYREFYVGLGGEYLYHQIQNQEVDRRTADTTNPEKILNSTNAKISYATVFLAIGFELFKSSTSTSKDGFPRHEDEGERPRPKKPEPEEKVRRSYPPYGI
jgi:hypothetical protein